MLLNIVFKFISGIEQSVKWKIHIQNTMRGGNIYDTSQLWLSVFFFPRYSAHAMTQEQLLNSFSCHWIMDRGLAVSIPLRRRFSVRAGNRRFIGYRRYFTAIENVRVSIDDIP